ncbi:MAG TPA: hypothetical protein VFG10_14420 [Saprospiraceae bacterium]|nr:hypothetical protein [Saprospiraceae bacterium]
MKNIFFIAVFMLLQCSVYAQGISVNANGATPDNSAMLDVSSQSKGVLIPRMRSNERVSIVSPAEGLLVYDVDSHSFWYAFGGIWKEILNNSSIIPPSGPALGDLTGSYPAPTVAKLQNLDVAFGVPFDRQSLKWDQLNNKWKAQNDSLFLPYNVTYGSSTKLFGITNTNTTAGSSAVYGKSGLTGSGITPATTSGVWGDNSNGIGIVGTSNTGVGAFGFSFSNHGVSGYSTTAGFAGVKGTHANAGGVGVLGEVQNSGAGISGQSISTLGKAGLFQSTFATHTDTTLAVSTIGLGTLSQFNISNSNNSKAAVDITNAGGGAGLKVRLSKFNSIGNGVDAIIQGSGIAVYGTSENGIGGKFENTNASNTFPALILGNNGMGSSLYISSTNSGQTGNVVDVLNNGSGFGLSVSSTVGTSGLFTVSDANSTHAAMIVQQQGLGKGMEINLSKNSNNNAGLSVNTLGTTGITSFTNGQSAIAVTGTTGSTSNNAIGIKGITGTNASNGIGVLGQAGANDQTGIGVKGIAGGGIAGGVGVLGEGNSANPQAIGVKGTSYTHNENVGAVTGINMTDGVGVYGEALGSDGIGVAGTVGNTSNHSVAGVFTNNYANNNRAVVELISNGKGNAIFADNTNLSGNDPQLRIRNAGTGKFLQFETNLGAVRTTISKEGNIDTEGTVTVKGDKGIVRSSTGTQLRTETFNVTIPAGDLNHYDEFNATIDIDVNFSTPFASAPAVYLGQTVSGSLQGITVKIENVTSSGCELSLYNYTPYNFTYVATTLKVVALGAE